MLSHARVFAIGLVGFAMMGWGCSPCGSSRHLESEFDPHSMVWEQHRLHSMTGPAHLDVRYELGDGADRVIFDVEAEGLPPETEVDVSGTSGEADSSGALALRAEAPVALGEIRIGNIAEELVELDLDVPITIAAPEADVLEERVPPIHVSRIVGESLIEVPEGGVTFPGEPEEGREGSAIAALEADALHRPSVVGDAETVSDLGWVAIAELHDSGREATCAYELEETGAETTLPVAQYDAAVTIYDRRTGEAVAERTFEPEDECPRRVAITGRTQELEKSAEISVARPWIEDELERLTGAAK